MKTYQGMASLRRKFSSFIIAPEVKHALQNNLPVVGLESTIISHGMPYPQNYQTAMEVENIVRKYATPATIAILNGKVHIGLTQDDLHSLSTLKDVKKCSTRDLPIILSTQGNGATTVASTMRLCSQVGINVFATGGIGGVHRGVENTMDISADLVELGKTPVAVVCAGVKSILDIPRTLQYLETMGVPVVGYKTTEFPAFYTPHSGIKAPSSLSTPEQVARAIHVSLSLKLNTGMVIGVPNPEPAASASIETAISQALKEADMHLIKGAEVTPFLLKRVAELTKGDSLRSNIALIKHNAFVASEIALSLNNLVHQPPNEKTYFHSESKKNTFGKERVQEDSPKLPNTSENEFAILSKKAAGKPIVIGGSAMDILAFPIKGTELVNGTKSPGVIHHYYGGVGRNISEALARLGVPPLFISLVGDDDSAKSIIDHVASLGIPSEGIIKDKTLKTPCYLAIHNSDGEVHAAITEMSAMEGLKPEHIAKFYNLIRAAPLVILDANLSLESLNFAAKLCAKNKVPILFETVSVAKSLKCIESGILKDIKYLTPSLLELIALGNALKQPSEKKITLDAIKMTLSREDYGYLSLCFKYILRSSQETVILSKLGEDGVVLGFLRDGIVEIEMLEGYEIPSHLIKSTTGAGDNFAAGFAYGLLNNLSLEESIMKGQKAASISIQAIEAVSNKLNAEAIKD